MVSNKHSCQDEFLKAFGTYLFFSTDLRLMNTVYTN